MEWNLLIGAGGLLVAFVTLVMNRDHKTRESAKESALEIAKVQGALQTINNGIVDIRVEIGKQRDQVAGIAKEQARMNEAFAALARRVDRIEEECKLHTN